MPWKVKILDKEVYSSECPHIYRSPMEQICTCPNDLGAFICHDIENCPLVTE